MVLTHAYSLKSLARGLLELAARRFVCTEGRSQHGSPWQGDRTPSMSSRIGTTVSSRAYDDAMDFSIQRCQICKFAIISENPSERLSVSIFAILSNVYA